MHTRLASVVKVVGLVTIGCLLAGYAPTSEAATERIVRRREVIIVPAAAAAKGKEHSVSGKLVAVSNRSITVASHKKEKGKDHTFEITRHTKIEGQKKGLAALTAGEHVVVKARGKRAEVITVHKHHKKKKKA
jgi:hypothetical protein